MKLRFKLWFFISLVFSLTFAFPVDASESVASSTCLTSAVEQSDPAFDYLAMVEELWEGSFASEFEPETFAFYTGSQVNSKGTFTGLSSSGDIFTLKAGLVIPLTPESILLFDPANQAIYDLYDMSIAVVYAKFITPLGTTYLHGLSFSFDDASSGRLHKFYPFQSLTLSEYLEIIKPIPHSSGGFIPTFSGFDTSFSSLIIGGGGDPCDEQQCVTDAKDALSDALEDAADNFNRNMDIATGAYIGTLAGGALLGLFTGGAAFIATAAVATTGYIATSLVIFDQWMWDRADAWDQFYADLMACGETPYGVEMEAYNHCYDDYQ